MTRGIIGCVILLLLLAAVLGVQWAVAALQAPITGELTQAAQAAFGGQPRVSIVAGKPPAAAQAPASPAPQPSAPEEEPLGKLDDLIAFGQQFDNITIK